MHSLRVEIPIGTVQKVVLNLVKLIRLILVDNKRGEKEYFPKEHETIKKTESAER